MKLSVIVFGVLLTVCCTSTDALTCYQCVYFEGHASSDSACEKKPSSDRVCTTLNSLESRSGSLSAEGHYTRNETLIFTTDAKNSRQGYVPMCAKFTGTLDGRQIVYRDCAEGVREAIGICTKEDVTLVVDGRYASNVEGCFCSGDRCNSATVAQITYYLALMAVSVHTIYKFAF